MIFSYYRKLTVRQKAIYRKSDEIDSVRLPDGAALGALVRAVEQALVGEELKATQTAGQRLVDALCTQLEVAAVRVKVLAQRPANDYGELHGLYILAEGRRKANITVWMRTARRQQVVAFRTFLRTLLHEFCHHLDYSLLDIADSFHTEGFYRRESSLFYQLVRRPTEGRLANSRS